MNRRLFLASVFGAVAARALSAREFERVAFISKIDYATKTVTLNWVVLVSGAQDRNRIDFIGANGSHAFIENLAVPD